MSLGGGNYQVNAPSHIYTAEGNYPISVTVKHELLTPVTSGSQTIDVAAYAAIDLSGTAASVNQGRNLHPPPWRHHDGLAAVGRGDRLLDQLGRWPH